MTHRFEGEHGRFFTGEECNIQRLARDVGCHPLRLLRPAQRILVLETLLRRYFEPVERAGAGRIHVRVKDRAHLRRFEIADLRNWKCFKADRDLQV